MLFNKIKECCPQWRPSTVKLDFEIAAINACKAVFPETFISGCNLHFAQSLWRRTQECGLVQYKECKEICTFCRMCVALRN